MIVPTILNKTPKKQPKKFPAAVASFVTDVQMLGCKTRISSAPWMNKYVF